MSVINRVPQGLLALLDSKTGGRTPGQIDPAVQASIDVTQMYAADVRMESAFTAASLTSADIGTLSCLVTVPANELWMVYGVSSQIVVAITGDDYDCQCAMQFPGVTTAHFLTGENTISNFSLQTFEQVVRAVTFSDPWIVGPGTVFGTVPTKLYDGAAVTTTSVAHRAFTI